VESATPGVERWLAALPDGDLQAGKLPSAVLAVAGQALRTAEHPHQPGEVAVSRVLSRSGTWVLLHGASLVSGGPRRVAVIVEPAHPARIAPLPIGSGWARSPQSSSHRGASGGIAEAATVRARGLRSIPSSHPPGPTRPVNSWRVVPSPQPRSGTRASGAAVSSARRRWRSCHADREPRAGCAAISGRRRRADGSLPQAGSARSRRGGWRPGPARGGSDRQAAAGCRAASRPVPRRPAGRAAAGPPR
jgi:hypothetical protein